MTPRRRVRGPALALAILIWVAARPPAEPGIARCERPGERQGQGGWSTWVDCDTDLAPSPLRGATPLLFGRALDLNRVRPRALEALPGIGPARAGRIARERRRRPFASLADLERVHGIGPGIVRGLEGWATVRTRPPPEASRRSQKSFQLLSNPCENSYKRPAGSTPSVD